MLNHFHLMVVFHCCVRFSIVMLEYQRVRFPVPTCPFSGRGDGVDYSVSLSFIEAWGSDQPLESQRRSTKKCLKI